MKVVDLNKVRTEREQPDEDCMRRDEYGRPVYCFLGDYEMDGDQYSVDIWAYDLAEAERRAAAMGNVTIAGQLFSAIPA